MISSANVMRNHESWLQEIVTSYRHYDITPVPKPRMTQSDKWKRRECVLKYRDYCDKLRELNFKIKKSGSHIVFVFPMPKSWSKRIKDELRYQPHSQTPDVDNCLKACMDAVFKNDSHVFDIRVSKFWGDEGAIYVRNS